MVMDVTVASRDGSHFDDFADMMSAEGPQQRWDILVRAFTRSGLPRLAYGFADAGAFAGVGLCTGMAMSTMSTQLMDRYFGGGYHTVDPLIQYLRAGRLEPLPFDIDAMEDPPEALRDIRAMGVVSGMLVPLPPLSGCPVAGLIAGSEQTFEKTSGMLERDCRRLVALTHLFHARASGELMRRRDGAAALTPRERDSLQMIARGERVASVAHQLGLAEATIELHLRNARRKLGARSLPEAVARGLLYRQIEPG